MNESIINERHKSCIVKVDTQNREKYNRAEECIKDETEVQQGI